MSAFATPDQLASYLGADAVDPERAAVVLDGASEDIRNYTRQLLDAVTDEAVELFGSGREVMLLPELPVTELGALTLDGTALSEGVDYRHEPDGILRRLPDRFSSWYWWGGRTWLRGAAVALTYSHGFDPIPADIVGVCLRVAARAYRNPEGATEQSITNYTVVYGRQPGTGAALTPDDERLLDRYRIDR